MKYIKRAMEAVVTDLSSQYPALLVAGPRQVGKTTMLQELMKGSSRTYVTLDDLNARALAKNDPAMFFQIYKAPILIDEIQYAPELFTYIKIMIDKKHNAGDFWLTGSQMFRLMKDVSESLAGRVGILNLSSLSQNEIYGDCSSTPFKLDFEALLAKSNKIDIIDTPMMYERIFRGSMPTIISGKYKDISFFYNSYLSTYLERDIRELSGAIDSLSFIRFLTATAARCSQIINYTDIARDADINQITVKKWLNILETLGIIFYLHPYSNNVLKRTIKTPKLYFYDTGLCVYLSRWSSPETLENGAMNGSMLENYTISEMVKSYYNAGKTPFIYYYRDKDMKEIDLIIEGDGKLYPMEIKKTASPNIHMINAFTALDKLSAIKRDKGAVLCMSDKLSAFNSNNYIIPISLI